PLRRAGARREGRHRAESELLGHAALPGQDHRSTDAGAGGPHDGVAGGGGRHDLSAASRRPRPPPRPRVRARAGGGAAPPGLSPPPSRPEPPRQPPAPPPSTGDRPG